MDVKVADAVRLSVLSVSDDEDAVQEALIAAWRALVCGMPLKRVCRVARAAAEKYVVAQRARLDQEVPMGLLV